MPSKEIVEFWDTIQELPRRLPLEALPEAKKLLIDYCVEHWKILSGVDIERVTYDGIDAVWHRPAELVDDKVILYIHGGGSVWNSADTHVGIISRVATASRCAALALDYKVAPESPFPGPVKEGLALYRWLVDSGWNAKNIAIVGDSAGGGLAMAIVGAIQAAGLPLPAAAVVSSAWTDLTNSGESIDWVETDPCVSREGLDFCVELYLQGHDPSDPLASPLFADMTGYPPMLVQAGSRERLLSDSTRLAATADAAGVEVELEIYDGVCHLWHWWVPESPEAQAALRSISRFVIDHTSAR